MDQAHDPVGRAKLLPAHVEVMLAANDIDVARAAADELSGIAAGIGAPLLDALAGSATGGVLLAVGDARGALETLRRPPCHHAGNVSANAPRSSTTFTRASASKEPFGPFVRIAS